MTLDDKELMGRYIYQVIRRLSRAQRDEVRMELEELISDMYADKGSMETVLTQLGDPAEFAKQYQNDRQYLIGPEYFETYLWFVKVILIWPFPLFMLLVRPLFLLRKTLRPL